MWLYLNVTLFVNTLICNFRSDAFKYAVGQNFHHGTTVENHSTGHEYGIYSAPIYPKFGGSMAYWTPFCVSYRIETINLGKDLSGACRLKYNLKD